MRLDARRNSSTRLLRSSAFIRSSEEALIWFNSARDPRGVWLLRRRTVSSADDRERAS